MSISRPFIERPIATALLVIGIVLPGVVAYGLLPITRSAVAMGRSMKSREMLTASFLAYGNCAG